MKLSSVLPILLILSIPMAVLGQVFSERNSEYVLHQGDVLEIHYRYTPEFNQTVTVRPDDRVTLLNIGTVLTYKKTISEFKDKVVELSKARLVDPDVTVVLKEFEKPHVYVEGEVGSPGRVELRSDMSVLDAIALAGGFKTSSAKNKVLLMHHVGNRDQKITTVLNLKKLIDDKQMEEGVQIKSGDVIYVTQNSLSKVERIVHMGQFGAIYNPIH